MLPPSTSTRRQIGGLVSSSVTSSWNTSPASAARGDRSGAVRSPGNAITLASGSAPPMTAASAAIGGAFVQPSDDEARHAERERLEVALARPSRATRRGTRTRSSRRRHARSFVGPIRTSLMALRSAARNVSSTPCRRRTASIAAGTRSSRVAAGASSMNTGSSVRLLTSSATCGRQNSALANQSPSARGRLRARR